MEEFGSYGFQVEWYASIDEGKEAIQDRLVSDNVILITSGSLTKEENPGGSIIKIYHADEDIREKI